MHYSFPPDVQELVASQMASGRYTDEDEVLREALRVLYEVDHDAAAIQEAIDDWANGDEGLPLDQAFDEIRTEFRRKPSA